VNICVGYTWSLNKPDTYIDNFNWSILKNIIILSLNVITIDMYRETVKLYLEWLHNFCSKNIWPTGIRSTLFAWYSNGNAICQTKFYGRPNVCRPDVLGPIDVVLNGILCYHCACWPKSLDGNWQQYLVIVDDREGI